MIKGMTWKAILLAAGCLILAMSGCDGLAAPASPRGIKVPVMASDSDSVFLLWQRPSSGDDVAFYNIYVNGNLAGSTKDPVDTDATSKIKKISG